VFPGNGKSKTLPVQTVYLIHFTTSGTNEEVCQKNSTGSDFSGLQNKIHSRMKIGFIIARKEIM